MKKPILISIAILIVVFVIVFVSREDGIPLDAMLPIAVFLFIFSLPGILLSLLTLIPAIRKRAQNKLAVRIITILVVVILTTVVMFVVPRRLEVEVHYLFAFFPRMLREEDYDYSDKEFYEFQAKYEEKSSAIIHETWLRVMVPPFLRRQCYTADKDVCEFVDHFPETRQLTSRNEYYGGLAFVLALSLPGGVFAWHFTHRKIPQEIDIEGFY